jgi:putative ABC transport system permease protein
VIMEHVSPRWAKLVRDVRVEKERAILMFAALTVSLFAVSTIFGAWQILRHEIRANYLSTRPAMATLEIGEGIDGALLEWVKKRPEVAQAEAHDVIQARVQVGEDWLPLLVFASDTLGDLELNRFFPERGTWPVPTGSLALERTAFPVLGIEVGDSLRIKLPNTPAQTISVSSSVHDPGVSPAYQERMGYAYATTASLRSFGEDARLHELRVAFRMENPGKAAIEEAANRLATEIVQHGGAVHEIRVPPFERHPHQLQMETVLLMLLLFAALALVLSSVLVATTLSAWLARQTRELAVMKAVGATGIQVAGVYVAFVAGLGGFAWLVGWPVGVHAAIAFSHKIAAMLNFTIVDTSLSVGHPLVVLAAGVLVPVAVAAVPIRIASRKTIREAMTNWGAVAQADGAWTARLPRTLRQILRRPMRLALSLALLGASGAIFLTSLNVSSGWTANLDKIWQARHYDVEVRFRTAQSDSTLRRLAEVPGILEVEPWGWTSAGFAKPGRIDMLTVWPDKGHGSLSLMGMPPRTKLVDFPLMKGRRLEQNDTGGAVLNHIAWIQAGRPALGSPVSMGVDGRILVQPLVGVLEEVGSPGIVYVTPDVFAGFCQTANASRMIRVVTAARTPSERSEILRRLERAMERDSLPVQMAIPFSELRTAIGDHMKVLIGALFGLSALIGLVGVLGLISVTGMEVLERTKEFAIMKTLGATPGRILGMVVVQALVTGWLSWVFAVALAVPLTMAMDRLIGSLGFLAPLPMVFRYGGAALVLVAVTILSILSGWIPARRAGRITVREALTEV